MLTSIGVYWFTGSGAAAANYIWENVHARREKARHFPAMEEPELLARDIATFFAKLHS